MAWRGMFRSVRRGDAAFSTSTRSRGPAASLSCGRRYMSSWWSRCAGSLYPADNRTGDQSIRESCRHMPNSSTLSEAENVSDGLANSCPSPVDGMAALLDILHDSTAIPWWLSISSSAVLLRVALFPLKIIELKKLAQIKALAPKLQLQKLVRETLNGNFRVEYKHFKVRKRETNCPSLLWNFNPGVFVQLPLFLITIYTLRKMALENHPGFATGGILWFMDLTVAGEGLPGTFLPLIAAVAYYANLQVSLRGHTVMPGLLGEIQKIWIIFLRLSTILVFLSLHHFPQAVLMFSVPHFVMTLGQALLLDNPRFLGFLVGSDTAMILTKRPQTAARNNFVSLGRYETLLKDAGISFTSGDSAKAICILESAIQEESAKGDAHALLGWVYSYQQDWANSAKYYQEAISKGQTDEFRISAYAGGGAALFNQGKMKECVELLKAVREYNIPTNVDALHSFCSCLLILSKALIAEGLEDECKDVIRQLKEIQSKNSCVVTNTS